MMIRLRQFVILCTILYTFNGVRAGEIIIHNGTNGEYATTGTGEVQVSLDNDYTYPFSFGNTDGARLTKTFNEIAVHTMTIYAGPGISQQPGEFIEPGVAEPGIDATFEQVFNNTGYEWDSYHVSWSGPAPVSTGPSVGAFGPPNLQEIDGNTFNIYFDTPLEIGGFFYLQINFNIDPLFVGAIPDGDFGGPIDGVPDAYLWDYQWTFSQYAVPSTPVEPPAPVPEPGTLGLLLLGAIGLISRRRCKP